MLDEREFRGYLWAYWCAAAKARRRGANALVEKQRRKHEEALRERDPTAALQKKPRLRTTLNPEENATYDAMLAICQLDGWNRDVAAPASPVRQLPERRPDAVGGFCETIQALWLRPYRKGLSEAAYAHDASEQLLRRDRLDIGKFDALFERDGTIFKTLACFPQAPEFQGVINGGIAGLNERQCDIYRAITGREAPGTIPFAGVFLVAREPGVCWIGLCRYDRVRGIANEHLSFSDEQVLPLIRKELDRVRPYALTPLLRWWSESRVSVPLALVRDGWEAFVRQLRSAAGLDENAGDPFSPVCVLPFVDAADNLRPYVLPLLVSMRDTAGSVVLVTNVACAAAIELVRSSVPSRSALHVEVLGAEQVAGALSRSPWLWSRYFGANRGFSVFKKEPERLYAALTGEPLPALVMHEYVENFSTVPGKTVVIHGRKGSGKTTFLYQVLAREEDRTVIVVHSGCTQNDWRLAQDLLADFPDAVVAVDGIEDVADQVVRAQLLAKRKRSWSLVYTSANAGAAAVAVNLDVVDYWVAFSIAVAVLGNGWIFEQQAIEFWTQRAASGALTLADYLAALKAIAASREYRPMADVDATLFATATTMWASDTIDRFFAEEDARSNVVRAHIAASSSYARTVWTTIVCLRWLGILEVGFDELVDLVSVLSRERSGDRGPIRAGVDAVLASGWLRVAGGVVDLDDAGVKRVGKELWTEQVPSFVLMEFFDVLWRGRPGLPARVRLVGLDGMMVALAKKDLLEAAVAASRTLLCEIADLTDGARARAIATMVGACLLAESIPWCVEELDKVLKKRTDRAGILADAVRCFAPSWAREQLLTPPHESAGDLRIDVQQLSCGPSDWYWRGGPLPPILATSWKDWVFQVFGPGGIAPDAVGVETIRFLVDLKVWDRAAGVGAVFLERSLRDQDRTRVTGCLGQPLLADGCVGPEAPG